MRATKYMKIIFDDVIRTLTFLTSSACCSGVQLWWRIPIPPMSCVCVCNGGGEGGGLHKPFCKCACLENEVLPLTVSTQVHSSFWLVELDKLHRRLATPSGVVSTINFTISNIIHTCQGCSIVQGQCCMRNSIDNCILHANCTLENTQMLTNANNFVSKLAKNCSDCWICSV